MCCQKHNFLIQAVASFLTVGSPFFSHSDDNLLKNIELFDKLSLRFHERILFIKNVIGSGEICCWTYYGNGKKVAEICCTSIVYATERKHTKVEFPEARIYEETLNVLLYEKVGNSQPDAELLRALGTTHVVDDDEDGPVRRHRSGAGE
jgi:BTB/POZ domain-containing adapter for CUL3-mediated RhoA degradation protein